jgi:AcrR family transcriptional regulator
MARPRTISDEMLLARCRDAFLKEGFTLSTRRLAELAGVSEGLLFQRFHSKDELFFASMRLPPPNLDGPLQQALQKPGFEQAVLHLSRAALDYLRTQMPMVLLALSHPAGRDAGQAHHLIASSRSGLSDAFGQLLTSHPGAGRGTRRHKDAIVITLISTLLTRALHEQLGLDDAGRAGAWLKRVVAGLSAGFSG